MRVPNRKKCTVSSTRSALHWTAVAAPLAPFHPVVQGWFQRTFEAPTQAQAKGWPAIARGESTLLLAPTGSGKTLAAFLFALNRLFFGAPAPDKKARCRVLYISPLKALGVDVERNLRAPIVGIQAEAERTGTTLHPVEVGVRTGDTPQGERARMLRHPPDILITTPESLYLLLTSQARATLASVEVVIVDEIHSMVATKRGAHLFLALERMEALPGRKAPLQRVGLSATQRPLDEVARLLGGGVVDGDAWRPRPVTIVDAGRKRAFELKIEVPVEDMKKVGQGPGPEDEQRSIWPSIHPRLVELIRAHRSTMVFVNSRRLAERLAAAINEVAEEELALAHHGSVAKDKRKEIEDRLKRGDLPAIVATSSLELGIDMGAVDLVIQIEAPPSVASGIQRVGRAGHHVGGVSRGVVFPKYRGDLLACAAVAARMHEGQVEATHYPRNPLDVLAQHVVAEAAMAPWPVERLLALVRGAAPFAELPESAFFGVLDMLSGRYASDDFAELRPRLNWDRVANVVEARHGARRIAVVNGGTIPDRGLYGVFLAGADEGGKSRRVGELDEEMVFESRPGDVFLLGASSWRIDDITHDRVLVTPAPGEPGKMPFWHGDRPGRAAELGAAVGALARQLARLGPEAGAAHLTEKHSLDEKAAANLMTYLEDQKEAAGEVPTDRTIVFERFMDEVGDWRVCLLSPFGARVHAAWATAVLARLEDEHGVEVDMMYADDGIVFRLPEAEAPPEPGPFFPTAEEVEGLVVRKIADTSLFASRFRENAGRALLLPKKSPQRRTPLWAQRRRSADLLRAASQHPEFPIILETYRECLRDAFDLPALQDILHQVAQRQIRVADVVSRAPSPFAGALLFSYVANFIYDGDAPLAERRAQVLAIDHAQLRELLGEAELRALLDPDAILEAEARLQHLADERKATHIDAVHDLLLSLGDLTRAEVAARCQPSEAAAGWVDELLARRRAVEVNVGGERRLVAAEDIGRLRDALGVPAPPGIPEAFLDPVEDPLGDLVSRYARTHGPFTAEAVAARLGLGVAPVLAALGRLEVKGRVVSGAFLPRALGGAHGPEWCAQDVLRALKRQSLAKLRKEVEPVEAEALARFLPAWQGLTQPRRGLDGVLSALEQLQGCPVPASALEAELLPARVEGYQPGMLDELCAAGEVMWRGLEPIGAYDGRVALYLTDRYADLASPPGRAEGPHVDAVRAALEASGAQFFSGLVRAVGAFPPDVAAALWALVWAGEVTNDTLAPLRSSLAQAQPKDRSRRVATGRPRFTSRRIGPPGTEGRWALLPAAEPASDTARRTALAKQLLDRYGVLVREAVHAEGVPGGFATVYPVLKAMEEAGQIRRGYFVTGLGATQFALPGADDRLRSFRAEASNQARALLGSGWRAAGREAGPAPQVLAATDPANPYGAALPWPERSGAKAQRAAGAQVILHQGRLLAYLGRTERSLLTYLPDDPEARDEAATQLASTLARLVERGGRRAILVSKIDGGEPGASVLAPYLEAVGFSASSRGLLKRLPAGAKARGRA
ncbi:MAG: DEAD/DEAH box helicase [Deltaproteobacteria bacterium]|nr:DEAD/DEAH box helicase [Deltaproteobacteria bacterium]